MTTRGLLLLCTALMACEPGEPTRDANAPTEWRVGVATEDLRLDGYDEDMVGIAGIAVTDEGTLVVTQPSDHEVRFYSRDGKLIARVGGEGEGPGEYQQPFLVGRMGDSVTVYDFRLQRMTVLDSVGNFGRTVRLSTRVRASGDAVDFPPMGFLRLLALRPDGQVLATATGLDPGALMDGTEEIFLVEASPDGEVQRVILRLGAGEDRVSVADGSMTHTSGFPLQNTPRFHLRLDGDRFVLVEGFTEGEEAGAYRVTAIAPEGDTLFARTYRSAALPITTEVADSVVDAWAERLSERSPRLAAAFRREVTLPSHMPPVLSVVNGRDGSTWIRLRTLDRIRRYAVLDESGDPVGMIDLPDGVTLREADRRHVWGTVTDDVGVQSVVRLRIEWPM